MSAERSTEGGAIDASVTVSAVAHRLVVDRIACDGAGLCAYLDPSSIGLDPWGYPIVSDVHDLDRARKAVRGCPTGALRLVEISG